MEELHVRSLGGLKQEITTGAHRLVADEPPDGGGENAGPNPYDLLLAALGACTAMTVQLYARHKGWPLEDVEVTLRHDRVHAADCADCETKEGMVDRIRTRLTFHGSLSDPQRERLAEIATRCPVHRTLTREILIDQEVAPRTMEFTA